MVTFDPFFRMQGRRSAAFGHGVMRTSFKVADEPKPNGRDSDY